ncbi:hypothetical protein ABMA28_003703 [Loxostege sticticalis]|uniref:Uncharacterized protein n=1 Tax=Loxostege sticticalis TaxID=481309 RepID=A0ABD0SSR7_LOXSC
MGAGGAGGERRWAKGRGIDGRRRAGAAGGGWLAVAAGAPPGADSYRRSSSATQRPRSRPHPPSPRSISALRRSSPAQAAASTTAHLGTYLSDRADGDSSAGDPSGRRRRATAASS